MSVFVIDYPVKSVTLDLSGCRDLRYALKEAFRTLNALPGEVEHVVFDWKGVGVMIKRDSDLGWLERIVPANLPGAKVGPYPRQPAA